jgi:DNA replication regulator DPB11
MGGEHKLDLTSDVTHLLVEISEALTVVHLTAKYKYVAANREDVRVLQPAWLEAVRQSWMTGEKFNLQALEEEYKLPIFAGLSVCLTGFDDRKSWAEYWPIAQLITLTVGFRAQLQDRIIAHGGDYRGDLTKSVTHLIANAPEGKKYQYAEQWHVRVVSLRWFKDCLDRGMVLEESLYHPTLPLEEQGKGAWNQEAKAQIQLGKRPRDEKAPQEAPRKLRRTASSKLGSQSDNLWGDIIGGGFNTRPDPELPVRPSKIHSEVKSIVLEPKSFVTENIGVDQDSNTDQRHSNASPEVYQGYFSDQAFLIHEFPPKNVSSEIFKV